MTDVEKRHSSNAPPSNQGGFTVIELIVSLVIMGLVVLLIGSSLTAFSSSWDLQINALERRNTMLLGTQAFRRDIRSLRPIENVGREQRSLHFLGSPRALKFVGLGGGSQVQNGLRVIEYRVVPANGGFQLVRKFGRFDASGSLTNPSLKHPVVVLDHLLEGQFHYGSHRGSDPVWRRQWRDPETLPSLVSFSWRTTSTPTKQAYVARIRADTEQACVLNRSSDCALGNKTTSPLSNAGGQR